MHMSRQGLYSSINRITCKCVVPLSEDLRVEDERLQTLENDTQGEFEMGFYNFT